MTGPSLSDPSVPGPLDRATATALLTRADELLAAGEYPAARAAYARLVGVPDAGMTAAAFLGMGEALYRLDDEEGARQCWEQAVRLPENPVTYRALRQVAGARVRDGDLRGARDAYREAERRAPAADRAEIASRLGWLNKELGDTRAAGRWFSRSRAAEPSPGGDVRDHRDHGRRLAHRDAAGRQRPAHGAVARQAGAGGRASGGAS